MSKTFKEIPIEELFESPTNPRKHYNDASLKELAESIAMEGVLENIIVRPYDNNGPEKYEIICGSRRYRAAMLSGVVKKMPAIVKAYTDEEAWRVQITENLHREDIQPLDEAYAYKSMVAKGLSYKEISEWVAKSIQYIVNRLQLCNLAEEYQPDLASGLLPLSSALQISRLPEKDQKKLKKAIYIKNPETTSYVTAANIASAVRNMVCVLSSTAWSKDDETLLPEAGTCTACPKRSGFNTDLFDDVRENDRCFDPGCFNKKCAAFLERQSNTIKSAGQKEIELVSDNYGGKATISNWHYKAPVGGKWEKCKSEELAIVVESSANNGAATPICKDRKCPVHWAKAVEDTETETPEEIAEREAEELEEEKAGRYKAALLAALAEKEKPGILSDFTLYTIFFHIYNIGFRGAQIIVDKLGWALASGQKLDYNNKDEFFLENFHRTNIGGIYDIIKDDCFENWGNWPINGKEFMPFLRFIADKSGIDHQSIHEKYFPPEPQDHGIKSFTAFPKGQEENIKAFVKHNKLGGVHRLLKKGAKI